MAVSDERQKGVNRVIMRKDTYDNIWNGWLESHYR